MHVETARVIHPVLKLDSDISELREKWGLDQPKTKDDDGFISAYSLDGRRSLGSPYRLSQLMTEAHMQDLLDPSGLVQVELFGERHWVERNVILQCKITRACQQDCGFCIENDGSKGTPESSNDAYIGKLEESLKALRRQGVLPDVSVTGGEPLLRQERFIGVLKTLADNGIVKYNVNTNGYYLKRFPHLARFVHEVGLPYLNISLHHWDLETNRRIVRRPLSLCMADLKKINRDLGGGRFGHFPHVRLQCAVQASGISSVPEMEAYLDRAAQAGVDNVSFRGLAKLAGGHEYDILPVNIGELMDEIAWKAEEGGKSPWRFLNQRVSNYFGFENYAYRTPLGWVQVFINFSDMVLYHKWRKQAGALEKLRTPALVLYEDGDISGNWREPGEVAPSQP